MSDTAWQPTWKRAWQIHKAEVIEATYAHRDIQGFGRADLADAIREDDLMMAKAGFEIGYEAGVKAVFDEMDARGMFP